MLKIFFLIGNTIYTMTDQKAPMHIINKLGNCCDYETILEVELHKQNYPKSLASKKISLPLKPDQPGKQVRTYFWWENFDCKKESLKGSIHITHEIAFQEKSEQSTSVRSVNSITPSGKKALEVKTYNLPLVKINLKNLHQKFPMTRSFKMKKEMDIFSIYWLFGS